MRLANGKEQPSLLRQPARAPPSPSSIQSSRKPSSAPISWQRYREQAPSINRLSAVTPFFFRALLNHRGRQPQPGLVQIFRIAILGSGRGFRTIPRALASTPGVDLIQRQLHIAEKRINLGADLMDLALACRFQWRFATTTNAPIAHSAAS